MQTVVCDGCGKAELLIITEKNRNLKTVKLSVILETRESMDSHNERHEADLCSDCRTLLLSTYFRIKEGRVLELPKFIEKHTAAIQRNQLGA